MRRTTYAGSIPVAGTMTSVSSTMRDKTTSAVHITITLKSGATVSGWAKYKLTGDESDSDLEAHPLKEDPMFWVAGNIFQLAFQITDQEVKDGRMSVALYWDDNLVGTKGGVLLSQIAAVIWTNE